jgi:gliding motility-associated-like protein
MKGNNLDTEFGKLFENYSEEPSSNCWEAVSQKLDAIMPAGSPGTSGVSSGSSALSRFVASTVGKSVAIISAVSVVGVSLFAILNNLEPISVPTSSTTPAPNIQPDAKQSTEIKVANPFIDVNRQDEPVASTFSNDPVTNVDHGNSQPTSDKSIGFSDADHTTPIIAIAPKTTLVQPIPTDTESSASTPAEVSQEITDNGAEAIQKESVSAENVPAPEPNTVHSSLIFPNVFTPNGDGVNDYFVIKNIENLSQRKLVVVNAKTGQKVYESNNYQNNWDAANVPDGAYYYVLEIKNEGKNENFYGTVQIIR